MRLAFMGTPPFAAHALQALIDAGHEIACVYTQPPRPAGRGHKLVPSAVQVLAESRNIPVRSPKSVKPPAEHDAFARLNLDVAVVAAYGLILPQAILDAPKHGCINIHASLLPRWRGAAPIERAILAGDLKTGVSLMRLVAELDAGPVCASAAVAIEPDDDFAALSARLAALAGELLTSALEHPRRYVEQDGAGVTYAEKLTAADRELDGGRPAQELERRVRALHPHVGARLPDGLGVLSATLANRPTAAGILAADGGRLYYGASPGTLELLRVQPPGKRAMDAAAYLRGHAL